METNKTQEAGPMAGMARAAAAKAKESVDAGVKAMGAASDKARQMGASANDCVRDNPWMAVGVAAGVGIVIGFLLRGRRKS